MKEDIRRASILKNEQRTENRPPARRKMTMKRTRNRHGSVEE